MNDRELLELAAKAAGIEGEYSKRANAIVNEDGYWMPLNDDGDALRLAVKLKIDIHNFSNGCNADTRHSLIDIGFVEENAHRNDGDIYKAVRRSIVRAAALLGESMP